VLHAATGGRRRLPVLFQSLPLRLCGTGTARTPRAAT